MAPKRGSTGAASAAKRMKGDSEVKAKISAIVRVLNDDSALPSDVPPRCRSMLAAGAPHALAASIEERHDLQATVCAKIKETLEDMAAKLKATCAEAKTLADQENASIQAKETAAEAMVQATIAAKEAQETHLEPLKAARLANSEAVSAQRAIEKRKSQTEKEQKVHTKEKEKYLALQDGHFKAFVEGEVNEIPKKAAQQQKSLVDSLTRLGAENTLMAAFSQVPGKPDERREFDKVVVEELASMITAKVAEIDGLLAQKEVAIGEMNGELATAGQATEATEKAKEAEEEKHDALKAATAASEKAEKDAKQAIEDTKEAAAGHLQDFEQKTMEVDMFDDVVKGCEFLLARSSAEPPEEEAEPEAAPAAEEAAPAA
eukprot:gnl/TRDRNA2_/TRDRNA2_68527_c0_seq1.p1 gnl/TRDRNA2_/TRDRNA2_68527_c0~~gnl/TRDRNA2_/TRDRNA2_68527_c0_seq1.p1  ORF type:complete len:375 (-),score=146.85 gnl/TRDRNA2_/TRDRNA2_68527_c0_seq1:52-1176(-)